MCLYGLIRRMFFNVITTGAEVHNPNIAYRKVSQQEEEEDLEGIGFLSRRLPLTPLRHLHFCKTQIALVCTKLQSRSQVTYIRIIAVCAFQLPHHTHPTLLCADQLTFACCSFTCLLCCYLFFGVTMVSGLSWAVLEKNDCVRVLFVNDFLANANTFCCVRLPGDCSATTLQGCPNLRHR